MIHPAINTASSELHSVLPTSINSLPNELLERIIHFAEDKFTTRLVNWKWNVATLDNWKYRSKKDLEVFIHRLFENLDPPFKTELNDIRAEHQNAFESYETYYNIQRQFWVTKGQILDLLKRIPLEKRKKLQAISNSDVFSLVDVDLHSAIQTGRFESFFIVFVSLLYRNPYGIPAPELRKCLLTAIIEGHAKMAYEILSAVNIQNFTDSIRGEALIQASRKGFRQIVRVLLLHGPIPGIDRGDAACFAAEGGYLQILKELIANGPIDELSRRKLFEGAIENGHQPIVDYLLAHESGLWDCCSGFTHVMDGISGIMTGLFSGHQDTAAIIFRHQISSIPLRRVAAVAATALTWRYSSSSL